MRLKIAWLGPWNEQSAIAAFGVGVIRELVKHGHRVDVFRTETGRPATLPSLPALGSVQPLDGPAAQKVRRCYDAVVANVGDNFEMHGAFLPFLGQIPAILVLHDLFLANLCSGWAAQHADSDLLLRTMVQQAYGNSLPDTVPFWTDLAVMVSERPMVEYFAGFGYGAVVHAAHYEQRVRSACPGPVARLPLAAFILGDIAPPRIISGSLDILTIGQVNRNKRASQIIHAIASSQLLRQHCRYRLAGPIEADVESELRDLASTLDLPAPEFLGRVSNEELRRLISEADVISCLRNPALEGASAALVLSMASERPTLVTDHGCYSDVPDGLVLKCRANSEAGDVARHLQWILTNPDAAAHMGRQAGSYARETYSAKRYAEGLLHLIAEATPHLPGVMAGFAIGRELGSFGVMPGDPVVERLSSELALVLEASNANEAEETTAGISHPG